MNQPEEQLGNVPHHSEDFGNVPNVSAGFGNVRQDAESFRTLRNVAERTEQHTLTVREVARLFEQACVPRTERSIINWCQPNQQGIARLDAFYDTNERKYFITPKSVTLAISEEQAKQSITSKATNTPNEEGPKISERDFHAEEDGAESEALRNKVRDLEITNRVKDQVIGMIEKERERLMGERENYVRELMAQSHRIGQLETQVLQLGTSERDAEKR